MPSQTTYPTKLSVTIEGVRERSLHDASRLKTLVMATENAECRRDGRTHTSKTYVDGAHKLPRGLPTSTSGQGLVLQVDCRESLPTVAKLWQLC